MLKKKKYIYIIYIYIYHTVVLHLSYIVLIVSMLRSCQIYPPIKLFHFTKFSPWDASLRNSYPDTLCPNNTKYCNTTTKHFSEEL